MQAGTPTRSYGLLCDTRIVVPLCTALKHARHVKAPDKQRHQWAQRIVSNSRKTSFRCQTSGTTATAPSESPVGGREVKAVLFDMDGVLCDSEDLSRRIGAQVLEELYGLTVQPEEFVPFVGTGEANFLGAVARKYGAPFDVEQAKARFFERYLEAASEPNTNIGYPGARELVLACRKAGLKTAVASSADRVKVDANLRAAGFDACNDFDAIVSADAFERLKPAPDVFWAAAQALGTSPENCVVLEDAPAGIQAARAAGMRCIGVATSLSEARMVDQAPDAVRTDISAVALQDLVGLQRTSKVPAPGTSTLQADKGLDEMIALPGGYRMTRRDLFKFLPLVGIAGAGYAAYSNAKAFSYVSPKALLKALLPGQGGPPPQAASSGGMTRVEAFKRYIADKERRGGLEQVPEFPAGLQWFNSAPLKFSRELRGKVLVLDFWTYCCINCIHVLPELAALEAKYAGSAFAVVGVHSAKFDNEKDSEAIRNAVLRYEIRHPCVNDGNMLLWRELGISSWPTLAVVSPAGRLLATLPGEGQKQNVDDFIQAALSYYGERGQLDSSPLTIALERDKDARLASSPLRFPGKLAVQAAGDRLFIADSNNNRIVVTTLKGDFVNQIGGNGAQLTDGSFLEAAFSRPQGLAFSQRQNALFVADTENHALRKVDFNTGQVTTLAGNGTKGGDYVGGRRGRNQQLNSPWDLAFDAQEEALYIAMAGQHQIWRHNISSGVTAAFSGDGSERNANGATGRTTSWAQPSGMSLSADGLQMWIADSESSSVRSMALENGGSKGHVGGDPVFADNLFRFGDKDGVGSDAKLQHPLAVAALQDGRVLVADSYNHRLKVLDPASDRISSVAGNGSAGFADGPSGSGRLSEPAGLAVGPGGTVYVADTNNSVIRVFDLESKLLSILKLSGVPPPRLLPDQAPSRAPDDPVPPGASLTVLEPVQASQGELHIAIQLPPGYHLTRGATSRFETASSGPGAASLSLDPPSGVLSTSQVASATIRFSRASQETCKARVGVKVYFCQDEDVCLFEEVVFDVPFEGGSGVNGARVELLWEVSTKALVTDLPKL